MLGCFGWSHCSFKPALRDTKSDTWHRYSLTIPLAHKRQPWILSIIIDLLLLSLTTTTRNRSLESCLRISLKDFTLGMKYSLCGTELPYGSYYIKRENISYFHTENTCQAVLKDLHRHCHEKKGNKKRCRDKKAYFKAPKLYHFAYIYWKGFQLISLDLCCNSP